jgi:Rrf2 family protein
MVASRGVSGGFCLAAPPAGISIAAIVEAVDGPIALTACVAGDAHDCAIEGRCGVRGHWGPINRAVREALAAVTLAELVMAPAPARHEVMA